ncbi:phosphonate ABC transporter phosphonate-binding protein [Spiroplasma litorale]|uniref:Phosphonate ABC transporter phosphonate-binding protein n=1 Tax=Spiroplasma litorale TaxID=216942 RepID=A0A0K1W1K5_9MOLU|nr:PhnD/SsuA/transferrin family substrate-binding protein [Spiroplasma litorale]AKX34053.1 phosphonate ABC transporter phosphonate-binding protein [Spiroplasma litorale]
MKKILSIIGGISILVAPVSSIISCGGDDGNTFNISFVPSINATDIQNTVKPLQDKLESYLKAKDPNFTKKVKITTSLNYEAAGSSMKAGKSDLAFLPVNTYDSFRGESNNDGTYSDAGVLLISSRDGLAAETNYSAFKDNGVFSDSKGASQDLTLESLANLSMEYNDLLDKNFDLNNKSKEESKLELNSDNINKALYDKNNQVSYYRSYIFANKDYLSKKEDFNEKNIRESVKDKDKMAKLIKEAGKSLSLGRSKTSSGSLLYPLLWMNKTLGIDKPTELRDIYKSSTEQSNYVNAAQQVADGTVGLALGYADIRYDLKNDLAELQKAFKNTIVIGATTGIPNDGIMYSRKKVDETLATTLRTAFKEFVKDPSLKEVFDLYGHNDYVGVGNDQTSKEFEIQRDKIISNNVENLASIKEIVESL